MATKKLTVGMISDDIKCYALNTTKVGPDTNDSGKANWVLTVQGSAYFSYISRVTPYEFEPGTRHVPRTELPKLNYCIQWLCNTQKSEGYKIWGTDDEWTAFVKISATMDQNIKYEPKLSPGGSVYIWPPNEYVGPKKRFIYEKVVTGQRCPDLSDVERALEKAKNLPWWELRSDGKVALVKGVKFNDKMDCEKEPVEGMEQGAGDDQKKTDDNSWVNKGAAKAYDKLEKSIAVRLFQGFADGFGVSIKTLTYGLRFLTIISNELTPPKYKKPGDGTLCKCSGSGLSNDCWACRYEDLAVKGRTLAKDAVVKCVQDVPRVDGECPYYYVGGNMVKSWETKDECDFEKHSYCPPKTDPPNQNQ